ncbi:MAG: hypothetical protein F4137_02435 [Acidobacteria bacterium]|nr:hypothetical protein [Acidobacteriota bacterium]MYH27714.1 hypothetical protein [Acidobacteriota bacterium]
MRISITRDSGEVFAIHDVSEQMAEHLRYRLQDVNPVFGQDRLTEPDHAPSDTEAESLLNDLDTAIKGTIAGTFDAED